MEISGVNQVVPLRHQIVKGTATGHAAKGHAGLTKRYPAIHTSCSLEPLSLHGKMFVKFIKIFDAF